MPTTLPTTVTTPPLAPSTPVPVRAGGLGEVTSAARLVQAPCLPGADAGEQEALLRLALAHLALGSGGLWVAQAPVTAAPLASASALLPPGGHPDVTALVWMARVQLGQLAGPGPAPGDDPSSAWVLLPPRRSASAAALVDAALARAASSGGPQAAVVAPVPAHPLVAAVLRARGFSAHPVGGLLVRR